MVWLLSPDLYQRDALPISYGTGLVGESLPNHLQRTKVVVNKVMVVSSWCGNPPSMSLHKYYDTGMLLGPSKG